MMGAVFAMQGFGQLGGAVVMVCLVQGFKGTLNQAATYGKCTGDCQIAVDKMWRALIGIGVVPACIALYYRLTIPETPRYTFDVARDVEKANADVHQYTSGKHGNGAVDEIQQVARGACCFVVRLLPLLRQAQERQDPFRHCHVMAAPRRK
jgi:PHS family inorganic phosphate transporter-like MFS transporter